jgi:hypothetical protein
VLDEVDERSSSRDLPGRARSARSSIREPGKERTNGKVDFERLAEILRESAK